MNDGWLVSLNFAGLVGSGLMAGVFFAFSSFVMKGLGQTPTHAGIAAMQSINVAVINPIFMGTFLGTALICAASIIAGMLRSEHPSVAYLIAGALCYLAGTFLVTMVFNVPLNNALARLSAEDAGAAQAWTDYIRRWSAWNHVRTLGSLAALVSFAMAIRK